MSRTSGSTLFIASGLALVCATLAGCGLAVTSSGTSSSPVAHGAALQGRVFGGQQPIVGAAVYLYAAGNTGYGSAYTYATGNSLLGNHVVTTDGSGSFQITGDYTCPSSTTEIYIEAVGGTADGVPGDINPNVIMLAALGPCGNLSSSSYISMNELTTVASVWALAPFMTGPSNIGTSSTNSIGLTNAFNTVNTLVNIGFGQLNTTTLPAGATIPSAELNTLGNILAACVNQAKGGVAGDGSNCGKLFSYSTPTGGTAPTNTLMAALDIALNPGNNVNSIFQIASKYVQFSPGLTAHPTDWTVSIRYTANANLKIPGGIAADQNGNIWITNLGALRITGKPKGPYTLTKISPTGTFQFTTTGVGTTNFGAVAIDHNGYAWVQGNGTAGYLAKVSPAGVATSFTGAGLIDGGSYSIAVDGTSGGGNVWAGQSSSVAELNNSGGAVSGTNGFTGGGISTALSVAITPH